MCGVNRSSGLRRRSTSVNVFVMSRVTRIRLGLFTQFTITTVTVTVTVTVTTVCSCVAVCDSCVTTVTVTVTTVCSCVCVIAVWSVSCVCGRLKLVHASGPHVC